MRLLKNAWTTFKYNGVSGVLRKIRYKFGNSYKHFQKNEVQLSNQAMQKAIAQFTYTPKISVVMPVYKPKKQEFIKALKSILEQPYEQIEICLVNDGPISQEITEVEQAFCQKYGAKLVVVSNEENRGIAAASNDALAVASGEYVMLVDQDDMLAHNAVFEIVSALQEEQYDFIYSDEDMITEDGRRFNPQFKPDWSPHTLLSRMYVNHLSVYKKSCMEAVGGFRSAFDGCQDFDLLLRASVNFQKVLHIPKILYHWRTSENSIAQDIGNKQYIYERAELAIEEHLSGYGFQAKATAHDALLIYDLAITVRDTPKVSIIMPFKDNFTITTRALDAIITNGGYDNIEIILVDNQSTSSEQKLYAEYVAKYAKYPMQIVTANYAFNYAKINNDGLKVATGEYVLFLNNDIEFIQENTIQKLLSVAQLPQAGAVGATLLYPDNTIQHAGVILGYHEVAGHSGVGLSADAHGYYGRNVSLYNFSAVTAAVMMVKRTSVDAVGGFTEELSVAYNDVDFCLKLYEQGLYNINVGSLQVLHYESKTRGKDSLKDTRYQEECAYMWEKWRRYLERDPFYNENFSSKVGEMYQINKR